MSYGGHPYGGVAYAGSDVADIPADTQTTLAVEVSFTTDPLSTPVWVDITPDVRSWSSQRGRSRELERFQPGRATVVLSNLSAQYDSLNTGGPWFGNLKPMKRIRIRETFSGVTYPIFDGFVDRWQLDYPGTGKDATATILATDGFKVFARTELGRSVYDREVRADAPGFWWRLDEDISILELTSTALNSGSVGTVADGTYVGGVDLGQIPMIVNDAGSSLGLTNNQVAPGTVLSGVSIPRAQIDLLDRAQDKVAFTLDGWARPEEGSGSNQYVWFQGNDAVGQWALELFWNSSALGGSGGDGEFSFRITDHNVSTFNLSSGSSSAPARSNHHVTVTAEVSGANLLIRLYLNGTQVASGTFSATVTLPGTFRSYIGADGSSGQFNWCGRLSNVAVYLSALDSTRITAQQTAGATPWQGDGPDDRIGRILDISEWPASLRELDPGLVTLQSAELDTDALEHLQKVGETEYAGLLFMGREGVVKFVDRTAVLAREPYPIAFGDNVGEVGYRGFVPDDGDESIRNRATISRLNGAARTVSDTDSIEDFFAFDYTLDGLLHDTDDYSSAYAAFIVDQYKDQRRRITSVELGDSVVGQESIVYPAMLGLELGDAITVKNTPIGGIAFEQVCAVEGIEQSGAPKGPRTTRLILSPEFAVRALEDEDVATLGYAEATADQTGILAAVDLTSLSVAVTVGTSRRIRITGYVPQFTNTAGTSTYVVVAINEGATQLNRKLVGVADTYTGVTAMAVETPTAGSHTYKLRAESDGTVTAVEAADRPAFILVEDIGPA